jgi:hypothetical protein
VIKRKAVRIDHLGDMPLDLPGVFLRVQRRHWDDGTSCLHIAKWGTQPETGRKAPWWPPQYTQVPWRLAGPLVETLDKALLVSVDTTPPLIIRVNGGEAL